MRTKYSARIQFTKVQVLLGSQDGHRRENAVAKWPQQPPRTVKRYQRSRRHSRCAAAEIAVHPGQTETKRVYVFGPDLAEGDATMKELLGGKGASLQEMCRIGLSVPPGFTITTDACAAFHEEGGVLPDSAWREVLQGLERVEAMTNLRFGDASRPLLLSVRSGAAAAMPGMLDTVLNLGLTDVTRHGLASAAGARFAGDCRRRFLAMFGSSVLGLPSSAFEACLVSVKEEAGVVSDAELTTAQLEDVIRRSEAVYDASGHAVPNDAHAQLHAAIAAVFCSWHSERAVQYRRVNGITGRGTAATVQAMVFGNLGEASGTGVCFTRNPSTGVREVYGEFLTNAQGEDVVAGARAPRPLAEMAAALPDAYAELCTSCEVLERAYRDMQDLEFTVQDRRLYILQCRAGKRTGAAALAIAAALVDEGVLAIPDAVLRVAPAQLGHLLRPCFVDAALRHGTVLARGVPASPGAAVGQVAFDAATAEAMAVTGTPVVLVRQEMTAEDMAVMGRVTGMLTARGGMRSHAAEVARGSGTPAVTRCPALEMDEGGRGARVGGVPLCEGDWLSLNGATGDVIAGAVPIATPQLKGDIARFMAWADGYRRLRVMATAESPADVAAALRNGAEGIGLVRTERLLLATAERVSAVQQVVLAANGSARAAALAELEAFQAADFEGMFREMNGRPVTIRLFDAPLHDVLPPTTDAAALTVLAAELGATVEDVAARVRALQDVNPAIGHRGCRLGIAFPELTRMQVRAVVKAATEVAHSVSGARVLPKIMVPLMATAAELADQVSAVRSVAAAAMAEGGASVEYHVGVTIGTPRAALVAAALAPQVDFFCFCADDLTQTAFGLSRSDVGRWLHVYRERDIHPADPFQVIDQEGVGRLITMAMEEGRAANGDLDVGLCGEQGGDAASVTLLAQAGIDYISVSPLRVPVARLAAAQAVIRQEASSYAGERT